MTTSTPKQQEKAMTINSTSPRELIDTELDAVRGGGLFDIVVETNIAAPMAIAIGGVRFGW